MVPHNEGFVQSVKTGSPPGTLVYNGEQRSEEVKITLIEYNESEILEKTFNNIEECISHADPGMVKWINVDGIHKVDVIERIGKTFNIHPLTLEDIVNPGQRAKFEEFENYTASVLKMLYYNDRLRAEQLTILLLPDNLVISFQEVHGGDAFDLIRERIRTGKGRIRKSKGDYLCYALIDAVVDCYFNILEKIGDRIEELEDELTVEPSKKILHHLHDLKKEMIYVRKAVWPTRELVNNIMRSESEFFSDSTQIYFRDVHDHSVRIIETIETYRDLLAGMMDIYLSSVSNKMNEVMKVLTIISTIFIPVTFIAGVYGMNFEYMPELRSPYAYPAVWIIMLVIIVSLLFYFRKKKWI